MTEDDIREMDMLEYPHALKYSWITYMYRNLPFNLGKLFDTQQGNSKGDNTLDMNWSALNPITQAMNERKPPKKFLDSIKDE